MVWNIYLLYSPSKYAIILGLYVKLRGSIDTPPSPELEHQFRLKNWIESKSLTFTEAVLDFCSSLRSTKKAK